MAEKTKIVDIAPEYGISGDFKKISEYDFIALNAKILPVISILLMEEGSNQLMPDMGCRTELVKLPFSTRSEVEVVLRNVQTQLDNYTNTKSSISIDESKTNWVEGDLYLKVDIDGVPGSISLSMNKDTVGGLQPFNISHPSVFS